MIIPIGIIAVVDESELVSVAKELGIEFRTERATSGVMVSVVAESRADAREQLVSLAGCVSGRSCEGSACGLVVDATTWVEVRRGTPDELLRLVEVVESLAEGIPCLIQQDESEEVGALYVADFAIERFDLLMASLRDE